MQVVNVYVVRVQTAQARFESSDEVVSRRADIIGPVAESERCLGGDQRAIPLARERFAEHLFRAAIGVDVCGIEKIDASFDADIYQAGRFRNVGVAPCFEEFVAAAKCAGSKTENGNLEARASKQSIFQGSWITSSHARMQILVRQSSSQLK